MLTFKSSLSCKCWKHGEEARRMPIRGDRVAPMAGPTTPKTAGEAAYHEMCDGLFFFPLSYEI